MGFPGGAVLRLWASTAGGTGELRSYMLSVPPKRKRPKVIQDEQESHDCKSQRQIDGKMGPTKFWKTIPPVSWGCLDAIFWAGKKQGHPLDVCFTCIFALFFILTSSSCRSTAPPPSFDLGSWLVTSKWDLLEPVRPVLLPDLVKQPGV